MSEELTTAVTLAKMDGKLDVIAERLTAISKDGEDHESRIRALEARPAVDPDRIKALEERPYGITPAKLLAAATGIGSLCASIGVVATLLSR